MLYLLLIGLIVNFVGIVLIAISFGGTVEGAHQTDSRGRKIYLAALLHPRVHGEFVNPRKNRAAWAVL
jgi:hypothetical protein